MPQGEPEVDLTETLEQFLRRRIEACSACDLPEHVIRYSHYLREWLALAERVAELERMLGEAAPILASMERVRDRAHDLALATMSATAIGTSIDLTELLEKQARQKSAQRNLDDAISAFCIVYDKRARQQAAGEAG